MNDTINKIKASKCKHCSQSFAIKDRLSIFDGEVFHKRCYEYLHGPINKLVIN